ncbi:MAG: phospholipase D-like domain-containing protein, partial [Acidobacteriota bacterium]|nr:phospholipase D-like domain-containing protein [Acidobacteriota bacterium]
QGVRKFIEWCQSGKLEIKVYPSAQIHAKLYIMTFVSNHMDKGRVVTGSSNFSHSGLQGNLEFNVELKNRADYEFSLSKFNELWEEAVEVSETYVDTIIRKSPFAQVPPYELYLKFLYEYFKGELNVTGDEDFMLYLPDRFKQLKYQTDAVASAKRILEEYGGVFISDVVGLGKTYMSALLARQLDGRTLVIAPPALLDKNNPGSWTNVFADFRVPAHFESVGKLDDLLRRDISRYSNVFVDESHRFRTEATATYEKLAQVCRGKRVVLVTATPLNNSPRDILSQIKLFQSGKNSTIPNVRNLEAFFTRLEKRLKGLDRQADREEYLKVVGQNAKEIREKVLKYLMIRRTRSEISRYYADDLAAQNLKFPEVANPQAAFYELDDHENEVFTRTIELLTQGFSYARYRPLTYYEGASESELTGQRNLAKFMKILLVKRLESSFYAFRLSVNRFISSYERFIKEFQNGFVYISKKHTNRVFEMLEAEDFEAVERLIDEDKAQQLSADDFSEYFLLDLESDLGILREVAAAWDTIERDPKWECLRGMLRTNPNFKRDKLILFTESKETADYLGRKFKEELGSQVIALSGDSTQATRELVIQNFDARAFKPKNDYRILVTTEVLSEGVNLHRSNTVINYDIPWNPTRMIQRVGRVNRVDTEFDTIYTYNFFPTKQSNDLIKLREAAEAKIQAFIEMLGADARLLTEGEEIKSHDLFQRLTSKETITGEDEDEESELEFLKVIRDVRDHQPDLFARIKRLPRKARTAKGQPDASRNTLLTYFRKGKLEKFFLSDDLTAKAHELDFIQTAKLLQCEPETLHGNFGADFYTLLDRNKEAFIIATTEESDDEPVGIGSHDNSQKILTRLRAKEIKRFSGFTDEDESFMRDFVRLLEDGALPKPTTKKVWEAIRNETSALKILFLLKRDVPAEFFQTSRATHTRQSANPREVILSAYLISE